MNETTKKQIILVHQLYINRTLFGTFKRVDDAINAFTEWAGRGFQVNVVFNQREEERVK
jgi:hypothetical protein